MKKAMKVIAALFVIGALFSGCESQYEKDFESGMDKLGTKEKMTREEKRAVDDYYKWRNKQKDLD